MVVCTVGRKSGRLRRTPVTYAIADGSVYCVAGYGRETGWYLNALAAPDISLILPRGLVTGHVEEVTLASERLTAIRRVFRNAGLMGFSEGFDPFRGSDDSIRSKTADMPVLRIGPVDVKPGPSDPGGWAWLWLPAFVVVAVAVIVLLLR
jgi:deazaflavin-dependent oxidoreductase (nitroreductase family)